MRLTSIEAHDLSDLWFQLVQAVVDHGYEYVIDRGSYEGQKRKELDFVTFSVAHPGNRPLIPPMPEGSGLPPLSSDEYVKQTYLAYLLVDAKTEKEDYTYGEYLEKQFPAVIKMYQQDGFETNQACMRIGDQNSISLENPPCLVMIDTRIRYGALHFVVYFRSWDLWGGLPVNLAGAQLLKAFMASEIGVKDGEIIGSSKGLHLYDYSWGLADRILRRG